MFICHLKSQFAKYGIPGELIRDNGPQYSSLAFKEVSNNYGFGLTNSSPKCSQAIGEAERAVQTIEGLLKKAQEPFKVMLNYRHTIRRNRLITCTIAHGPQTENVFTNTCRPSEDTWSSRSQGTLSGKKAETESLLKEHFQERKLQEKVYYDKHSGKELLPLNNGEKVTSQHGTKRVQATAISKHHTPRSYIVQTPEGQKYWRNRKHLNKYRASQDIPTASAHDQPKASSNTHTPKVSEVPVPTTEAPPPQVQKPPMRTRSGRLVKQPTYLKEYDL